MSNNTSHKGQIQVVEGSAVGEFHVISKFSYNTVFDVEYLGECKTSTQDNENNHYIQKFIYDPVFNLTRIMIATNRVTVGCTEVSVQILNNQQILVTAHNGDFDEVEDFMSKNTYSKKADSISTGFFLDTGTQKFQGLISEKISSNQVRVILQNEQMFVNQNNVLIPEQNMFLTLNGENKPYEKRRWTNRTRYFYERLT